MKTAYYLRTFLFAAALTVGGPFVSTLKAEEAATDKKEGKEILFIRPDHGPPHAFFDEVAAAMQAAVDDLGDTLKFEISNEDHYKMLDHVTKIAASEDKPDAVIYISMRQNAPKALEILEKGGVNSFIFNAGLTEEQYAEAGGPREKMKHWLGEMLPDDVGAGHALGEALYNQAVTARPELKDGKVKMLVIEANAGDGASVLRTQGLKEYLVTNDNIEVVQFIKAKWDQTRAKELTEHMFKRYDEIDVIWAASDAMAIGGAEAAMERGLKPGEDIFVGGVDWSQQGLEAIEKGVLSASAGGHVMEGAWAAVVLHDYLNGADFAEISDTKMKSPMYIADKENLETIKGTVGDWDAIDFTKFSRAHNPDMKEYNFNILEVKAPE